MRLDKSALLFPNAPDTPNVPRNPDLESGSFLRSAKSLGFHGLRFHDLRHTYATLLIAGGANIKAVSQRLGDADITTTLRVYSHVLDSMDQKVSDIAESVGL